MDTCFVRLEKMKVSKKVDKLINKLKNKKKDSKLKKNPLVMRTLRSSKNMTLLDEESNSKLTSNKSKKRKLQSTVNNSQFTPSVSECPKHTRREKKSSVYEIFDKVRSNQPNIFKTCGNNGDNYSPNLSVVDQFIDEDHIDESCGVITSPLTKKKYKKEGKITEVELQNNQNSDLKNEQTTIKLLNEQVISNENELISSQNVPAIESDGNQSANYFSTNNGTLIILSKNARIHFYGLTILTVLYGEIEILGYTLKKNCEPAQLYSPRGSSLLYLKNTNNLDVNCKTDYVRNLLPKSKYYQSIIQDLKIDLQSSIVICKKLEEANLSFIEKHISQQIFPKFEDCGESRCIFEPKGDWDKINISSKWDDIISQLNKSTKLIFCGGKSVGKSTLLRYSINKLLMKFNKIRIIDLDPGQSEFTVPGCISIVLIEKPLFGVNYTHLIKTETSILSGINTAHEPNKYILSIKAVLVDYEKLEQLPTLINYMGYTHGLGINIASAAIACIHPTDVLQINSKNSKKNFRTNLSPEIVKENAKILLPDFELCLDYNFHAIESVCDKNDCWTLQARQMREMCILSYFGKMVDFEINSILSNKVAMFEIDLTSIKIVNANGEEIPVATINANLVALSALSNKNIPIFNCLGWGIVRGIDLNAKNLVLLTPEKMDVLEKVNYLVFNDISLPPSIYMTPDEVTGEIPYVNEGELLSFGQIPKRSYLSVKN